MLAPFGLQLIPNRSSAWNRPLPGPQQHLQEFDDTIMLLPARQKAASLIARYEAVVGSKTLPISVIFVAGNPLSSA